MLDDGLLVQNAVFQLHAFLNVAVLHDDAVFYAGPLVDLHPAEEHAVLDHTVYDTAVRDHRIDDLRLVQVARGKLVANLGVHRPVIRKQPVAHFRVQRGEIKPEVALNAVEAEAYIFIFIPAHFHARVARHALENIARQVVVAVRRAAVHQVQQQILAHQEHLHAGVLVTRLCGINLDIDDRAVRVQIKIGSVFRPLHLGGAGVHHHHVRAAFLEFVEHVVEIGVEYDQAVAQKHVFLTAAAQGAHVGMQRVQTAVIYAHVFAG